MRRGVSGLGRTFIAAGVLILLFVAYQLWGTGISEARSQEALRNDFLDVVEQAPPSTPSTIDPGGDLGVDSTSIRRQETPGAAPTTAPTTGPTTGPTTAATTAPTVPPPTPAGEAVAIMRIPKLDLEKAVIEGVSVADLKKGPGHYPSTPLPGQPGNVAIAGHRTTYGAPFFRLDELQPGDEILVTTRQGDFRYNVRSTSVVAPNQNEVLDPTDDNRLTLTTCHPRFSARQRLIVVADLADPPAPAPPPPSPDAPAPPRVLDLASEPSLSGDRAAGGPALAWGALAALVWLVTWLLSQRWGKVAAYALGAPVFLVVLFVFFENFARLLPANV